MLQGKIKAAGGQPHKRKIIYWESWRWRRWFCGRKKRGLKISNKLAAGVIMGERKRRKKLLSRENSNFKEKLKLLVINSKGGAVGVTKRRKRPGGAQGGGDKEGGCGGGNLVYCRHC